jgi:hypothetical protein
MSEPNQQPTKIQPAQWRLIVLVIALTVGSVLYKWLMHEQLGHSAAMFLGIPAVLAILLALTPKAQTATGGILKGITLALLVIAPLLGEGYLCILVASPLFYLIGIIVGLISDHERRKSKTTLSCVALLLTPVCLEGVFPKWSFTRSQSVDATQIVSLPAQAVQQSLAQNLKVATPLPLLLRIGFPRPLAARGQGLAVGDTRTVHFSGAEGDPPGDLVLRVADSRHGLVRFHTVSDTSKLTQWIHWTGSQVEWKALDANRTQVTWRIYFERQLDPAWYFAPWEHLVAQQAAAYLIDANISTARTN